MNLPVLARVWSRHVGRYQLIVAVTDEKDHYGFEGSQGYSLRLTFVRNPRAGRASQ